MLCCKASIELLFREMKNRSDTKASKIEPIIGWRSSKQAVCYHRLSLLVS